MNDKDNFRRELLGRVCADQIVPYPPGIPVLVPGQVVTRDILQYLIGLLRAQKRVELHGIVYDGYLPCLRVLRPAEERGLRRIDSSLPPARRQRTYRAAPLLISRRLRTVGVAVILYRRHRAGAPASDDVGPHRGGCGKLRA